ncbi:hypothetical protein [Scytonema sp. PRP1]|uniref:hypothetical protein n=1 Tax=Scytonema sp. PRP1 TaxID=3120513 RepID=UPI002FD4D00E
MLNTKEYLKKLDADLAVKEINDEVAANLQGGKYALQVYKDPGFRNLIGEFNVSPGKLLPGLDNQISSIKINTGKWRFANDDPRSNPNRVITLEPGEYPTLPFGLDNTISSIRRVG